VSQVAQSSLGAFPVVVLPPCFDLARASHRDRNQLSCGHFWLRRWSKASMEPLTMGLPGLERSNLTAFKYAPAMAVSRRTQGRCLSLWCWATSILTLGWIGYISRNSLSVGWERFVIDCHATATLCMPQQPYKLREVAHGNVKPFSFERNCSETFHPPFVTRSKPAL